MTKEKNSQGTITPAAAQGKIAGLNKKERGQLKPKDVPEALTASVYDMNTLYNYWRMAIRYQVKPSTYGCYCTVIQTHILPEIGSMGAEQFSNDWFAEFVCGKQNQGLSGNTIRLIVFLMKSIIRTGEEIGCCSGETLHHSLPRVRNSQTRLMSQENFKILFQRLMKAGNNFELGILISMCTGIRVGELCGLKWSDIDMESGFLQVQRTVSRIQNQDTSSVQKTVLFIGSPKTGTSCRDIPLPDFLMARLKENKKGEASFLLSGSEKCMEPRGVQRRFKNLLKKLGIPYVNIHSLRHSFASNWIDNGFDTKALSEILGHSSVKITMDIYVHSSMKQKRDYMNRMLEL